jgi:ribosomal protein S18 acetylase RimI-like enzyme
MAVGDIEIRGARPSEFEAVGELTAAAYLADGPVGEGYLTELRDVEARARAGHVLVAVDVATLDLLGTVSLFTADAGPRFAEGAAPGDAVMRMLAVAADARRRGAARALVMECIRRAQAMECAYLHLSTVHTMTAARSLYSDLGFHRVPHADVEPVPGVRLMAYRLDVGSADAL